MTTKAALNTHELNSIVGGVAGSVTTTTNSLPPLIFAPRPEPLPIVISGR